MTGNFGGLSSNRTVVLCTTSQEARQLVDLAHSQGYRWKDNPKSETFFDRHNNICYRDGSNGIIMYKSESFYREHGYNVISFTEFLGGNNIAPVVQESLSSQSTVSTPQGTIFLD